MKIIPYGRQHIDKNDIRHVSTSLKGQLITTGKYVENFEKKQTTRRVKYFASC